MSGPRFGEQGGLLFRSKLALASGFQALVDHDQAW